MDNVFGIEVSIITRLKSVAPALVLPSNIGSAANLVGRTDLVHWMPGLFTVPGPAVSTDSSDDGRTIIERQTWIVVATTVFDRDVIGLSANYTALGILAAGVINALSGWIPQAGFTTLQLISRDGPQPNDGGWVELPLTFETISTIVS